MKIATSFSSWPRHLLALLGLLGICTGAFAAAPRPPVLLAGPTPVGNYVFLDANLNNVFDAAESGIPGVRVCLYTSDGVLRETATTTATGLFSFTTTIQPNTSYDIRIKAADAPANRRLVIARQGGDTTADSDASLVGNTAVIVVQSSATGTLPTALGFGYAAGDPDLILTKTSDSFSVARGGTATFTLSVSNVGGSTATGVVVRDTLDTGMSYVSSSPAGTTALLGSGQVQVTWATGTLAAGAAATYTVTVNALADGVLTNTAGVTATSADATPRNNLASASFSVPAKLCQGGAYVTTLANNLTNVEWFKAGASVGTGNSLTIVTSGAYSYTAFSVGSGCQVSSCSPVIIYDGSVPNLTLASSATAICVGQSSVLSVSNCTGTVLWNTGAATTSITVSPTVTTGYSVTCTPTAVDACPSSVSATVTVNPSVTATVASQTICNGLTATLSASAAGGTGITYVWAPAGTGNTQSVTVSPSATTSYTVTATNSNGCSTTATATVTVNPAVTAVIAANPSTTICNGTSTTLTASATGGAGFTYLWSTGAVTATVPVSPTATTVYTVTATNSFGCSSTASTTITVNPSVTATLTSSTICYGTVASLSALGGTNYLFSNGTTNITGVLSVTPLVTTTYTVTVTNGNNCSAIATGTVTVNPAVTATVASATICNGTTATLSVSAAGGTGITYTWAPAGTGNTQSVTVSPSITTLYSVTATNSNGCSITATATVTVNPSVTATLTSSTICYGTVASLSALGGTNYLFSNGTTNITGVLSITPLVTTTYTVTVTNGNNCSAIATGTVTVNPAVTATVANQTICNGTTATLSASATGGTGLTYVWSPAGTGNTQSVTVSPSATTSYTVTVTNSDGCSTTATATVTVNPSVTATLSSATICNGTVASLSALGGTNYLFSNGIANITGTLSVTPTVTTTYTVTVTNGNGCSAVATGVVTVNPALTATIGVTPNLTICQGNTVALTANGAGGTTYNYTWSTGATSQTITASPTTTTAYSVTISEGTTSCSAVASTTITVNPTPVLSVNSPTICQEQTATLSLTGCAGTVTWSTGTTGATLDVTPLQTTSYTATCGLATGCSATIVTTVTVTPTPAVQRENVVVTRATCTGATANADASIALTGLQNTVRISISAANGSTTPAYAAATPVTGTAYTFTGLANPSQPVTYLISLYGANGTCTSTVTVTLAPADCTCPAPKCVPLIVRKIR